MNGRLCRFDSPAVLIKELEAEAAGGGETELLVREACGKTSGLGLEDVYLYYALKQRQNRYTYRNHCQKRRGAEHHYECTKKCHQHGNH